jgi:3'(2'), 5'-bisphosphate nucleotidase
MTHKELLQNAIHASLLAGVEIMEYYISEDFDVDTKENNTPVTQADIAASNVIIDILARTHIPIICEETAETPYQERKTWNTVWIVDPLDGTKDFIAKNDEFTVNIALIEKEAPVLGVIYVPVTDTLYYGIVGIGAYMLQEASTRVSGYTFEELEKHAQELPLTTESSEFRIVASRSHRCAHTEQFIEEQKKIHPNTTLISIGSSLKFCLIANGTAQLYPRFNNIAEWDTAAGDALVRAAGFHSYIAHTSEYLKYNKENMMQPHFIISG